MLAILIHKKNMIGVMSAGEVRLTYWREHDRPAPGRRYHAARPSAKAAPAPRTAGARGSPAPEGIQLEVLAGAGVLLLAPESTSS